MQISIRDQGPGIEDLRRILDGQYTSTTGMGLGIIGVRRLMDGFDIKSSAGGTTVVLLKMFPRPRTAALTPQHLARVADELARRPAPNPFEEVQQQNQDLLRALQQLQEHQTELARQQEELSQLNRELEDTNRGVVALYSELDEKADYLRRASEMKSRFLSNMSHEFRTPLNSILGLTRLLLDRIDGELTSEQDKQVAFIKKAAEDLTELVNDLLDLARVEAGKVAVRPHEFEAAALFGALRGLLRPLLAHNSSVSLVFEEPPSAAMPAWPVLETDESKVSQILRNFISNALKFTEHGEIRVSAVLKDEEMVAFSVQDTGIGIHPEDHERIFQEFTQVESDRQKRFKGTGLGLPLSRRLAELLGGRITLDSQPGVGSTFTLLVPRVYRGPAEVSFVPEISAQVDPSRFPVLVVEDNREMLFIYEKYLKGTGFQVVPARTLKSARRALKELRPLAMILDVLLEGESSWELLAEIKRDEQTRTIPVLVVTVVENQHKALALGADGFATKPVDRGWLLDQLKTLAQPAEREKALLIDDDEVARYLLRGLLADTRYEVIEAASGSEGLRLATRDRPGVIFLDLDMPDRNGFQVLESLRADPATRDVPVIIHTSRVLAAEDHKRLNGVAAVLSKTTQSREAALARVREALSKTGSLR